jgi:hypothetical protein
VHAKNKAQNNNNNNNNNNNSTNPKMEKHDLEKFKITLSHFIRAKEKMKIISKNNNSAGHKNIGSHIL